MKKNLLLFIAMLSAYLLNAQTNDKQEAMRLVTKNSIAIGISEKDFSNMIITDSYFDKIAGTRMVYLQQTYKNIPVYNQLIVLAFKNDVPVSVSGSFIPSIEKKVNSKSGAAGIGAATAVQAALADRKLSAKQSPVAISIQENGNKIEFGDLGVSRQNITAQLSWIPLADGKKVQLAWQVYVIPNSTSDYWMIRVDAGSSAILGMDNYTVYCNWDAPKNNIFTGENNFSNTANLFDFTYSRPVTTSTLTNSPSIVNNASYRVIPFPAESPIHPGGTNALVSNPWTSAPGNATSLKWNSDGTTDYTYTRGNNVWAQEDRNNNNGTGFSPASTTTPDP
jgi:extracellular elastinolytic metalloproteinase